MYEIPEFNVISLDETDIASLSPFDPTKPPETEEDPFN